MTVEVESAEDLRRGVIQELKTQVIEALEKTRRWVEEDKIEDAKGALSVIDYLLSAVLEWR